MRVQPKPVAHPVRTARCHAVAPLSLGAGGESATAPPPRPLHGGGCFPARGPSPHCWVPTGGLNEILYKNACLHIEKRI